MRAAQFNLENHNRRQAINLLLRNVPSAGQGDLRGIEWRYLWKKSQSDALQTFTHPDYLGQAQLSPDGRWLVTFGRDQQYYRRDLRRQSAPKPLPAKGHFDAQNGARISFHPEGLFVALCASDGTIHVIETTQWSTVRTFPGTFPIAFTPSGERLIFAEGRDLQAWEVSTGNLVPCITGASGWITHFACMDPQGRQIALKSQNAPSLELWDAESHEKQSDLETIRERVTSLKSSRDGRQVAAGALSGAVYAWNLDGGKGKTVFNAHNGLVMGLAFSPNGKILATGGADQVIRLWDVNSFWNDKTQAPLAVLSGHEGEIWDLSFSANGALLASASKDGTARLWDIETTLQAPEPFTLPETQFLVESSPDRATVTTIEPADGVLSTWNILTGSRVNSSPIAVKAAIWERAKGYPEHGLLAMGSMDGKIVVFSGDNSEQTTTLQVEEGEVWPWTLSPKGDLLMVASKLKSDVSNWSLWELNTGRRLAEGDDFVYGLGAAISPDQKHLVYTVAGHALRVLNLVTLETEAELHGHRWGIHKAVFSNDGRFLATSSNDEEIRIWDTTTWAEARPPLRGHQSGIYYLEFAPDGKTLLSAANDHTLRFWSLANGQELLAIEDSESLLAIKSPYIGLKVVSRRVPPEQSDRSTSIRSQRSIAL